MFLKKIEVILLTHKERLIELLNIIDHNHKLLFNLHKKMLLKLNYNF